MYRVTGSQKQFADVSDALGEAIRVVMQTTNHESTVWFASTMSENNRNLYTINITPTRRLSIVNLF